MRTRRFGRLRGVFAGSLLVVSLVVPLTVLGATAASAAVVLPNPGFEALNLTGDPANIGSPQCWQQDGGGTNTFAYSIEKPGRTGANASKIAITAFTAGSRGIRMAQSTACASTVTPGKTYDVSFYYKKSNAAQLGIVFHRRNSVTGVWSFWQEPTVANAASATYKQMKYTTPAVPANTDLISWGPSLHAVGTITTDDYAIAATPVVVPPTTTTPPVVPPTTTVPPVATTTPPVPVTTTPPVGPTTTVPPVTTTPPVVPGGNPNLNVNGGFEAAGAGGFPDCWVVGGSGVNTYTAAVSSPGLTGTNAFTIDMTARTSGDRAVKMAETTACAPKVVPGHTYDLKFSYKSTAAPTAVTLYKHDAVTGWGYWQDLGPLAPSADWKAFAATTPAIPAGTDMISWGPYVYGVAKLTVDDFSTVDTAVAPPTTTVAPTTTAPPAPANLLQNPGFEAGLTGGFPTCWAQGGSGVNTFTAALSQPGRTGANALTVNMTARTTGDQSVKMAETPACAPKVVEGHQYKLSMFYKSTTPNAAVTLYRHDVVTGWQYWQDLGALPVQAAYTEFTALTPEVPAGTDMIVWGAYVYGVGSVTSDDYSTVDTNVTPPPAVCTGTAVQCTQGAWQVTPYQLGVRAVHSVLLNNGKILLVAGSGNDPERFRNGEFKSAVYDPIAGTFTDVPTPVDMFCVGHAQLPDGRVLVMGGTKDYQDANNTHGFLGLNQSYVFDPATNLYTRINDMIGGHWYPSATIMGNGDVVSLGGLAEAGMNVENPISERYSVAQGRWLSLAETVQTNRRWGLYPTVILMQDGRLFYTGAHSLGGDAFDATGAEIYNYDTGTRTDVAGLQNKNGMDHASALLLHPAQDQKVMTFGGGNTVTNVDANRLTNIIDLKAANPTYKPGPLLPQGTMAATGAPQTAGQGKLYLSAVLLPDGKVFESGGSLHTRADDVLETSIYDPVANAFTSMVPDPVGRNYHNTAVLLPDGRVVMMASDPNFGGFDLRISIFSPPYLFQGPRPVITALPNDQWAYGTTQQLTVDRAVTKAQLIRPAATTHQSDPNQRSVDLPLTATGLTLGVNLTTNPNIAPPGWYMLTVTDANGVPSVAKWVHVG